MHHSVVPLLSAFLKPFETFLYIIFSATQSSVHAMAPTEMVLKCFCQYGTETFYTYVYIVLRCFILMDLSVNLSFELLRDQTGFFFCACVRSQAKGPPQTVCAWTCYTFVHSIPVSSFSNVTITKLTRARHRLTARLLRAIILQWIFSIRRCFTFSTYGFCRN